MQLRLHYGRKVLNVLTTQNEAAKDIQCVVCRATFLKTTRGPALTDHAGNKHGKTLVDCFPGFGEALKK